MNVDLFILFVSDLENDSIVRVLAEKKNFTHLFSSNGAAGLFFSGRANFRIIQNPISVLNMSCMLFGPM